MFSKTKKIYALLVAADLVFFGMAWVPNDSSISWLATIGWFGMMLAVAALFIFSVVLGIRAMTRRNRTVS